MVHMTARDRARIEQRSKERKDSARARIERRLAKKGEETEGVGFIYALIFLATFFGFYGGSTLAV